MKPSAHVIVAIALLASLVALEAPAEASFHLMKVREVFPGTMDEPDAQFIELQMYSSGQSGVAGHSVTVVDAADSSVGTFTFQQSVSNSANQSSILIATPEAETLFGISADLEMTPVIEPGGGKICWDTIDCVSWGSFSGPGTGGTGTPFNAPDGLVLGSSMERDISGGTDSGKLDSGDDTNDSAADFDLAPATPTNNAGATGELPSGTIQFDSSTYTVDESAELAAITVVRNGEGSASVDYSMADGSATAGIDYAQDEGTIAFEGAETSNMFPVMVIDDADVEGDETVTLTLTNPQGATLGLATATLTIGDDDAVDSAPPTTTITKPEQNKSYKSSRLGAFAGTVEDDLSEVASVEFALRKKLSNGKCKWLDGDTFVKGACGDELFGEVSDVPIEPNWRHELPLDLGRSVGTKIKSYTLYSRATDSAGNTESDFESGRNKNKFEVD